MMYHKTRMLPVFFLTTWFAAGAAWGKPWTLQLMRPDALAGWDQGDPPQGWSIQEGRLSGTSKSSPLLSAFTFADFQLRLRFSVEEDGQCKLLLPEVPSGKTLQLILCEGEGCGRLSDGENELAAGGEVKPRRRKMHTAAVRRQGGKLSFTVDGRWLYEASFPADRRLGLGLAVSRGKATFADLRAQEPRGEPMFNGKDLSGWWTKGDITKWRVEKNQVVLTRRAGDYLRTEQEYGNFTWSFQVKMQRGANSGLSVRTPRDGWPTADGMELQLLDRPYDAPIRDQPYMAVYGHVPPLGRADMSERWNRVVVKADGWMISAWVNGELVQQVNTYHHPELKHRQLQGWLGFQDHGSWIRVRDVRVLEAPEGAGLDAWYRPRPPRATTAVLDRLLNPERLSLPDGIRSAVAYKTVAAEQPGQHVLAELRGPGAVVRIARGNGQGRLAFYFDGESEPRVECPPGQMHQLIPQVGKDTNPLLTCLTFRDRLRIVLQEAARADYRFDYVTLPGNLPVETFVDPQSGFPRGWLEAAKTHLRWLSSGRFHEHDGLPRFASERQTIAPGRRAELVRVEGAGIVKSLKLHADQGLLENHDLWAEVTIDGEKQPAIAAPLRYLFPALTGNYDNYLLADQGGLTWFLAMPFGDGLEVAVVNRGGRPLDGIGATLSVQQATDETRDEIARRMRLRGLFLPAEDGSNQLVRQQGRGRWVGLVCQLPEGGLGGLASLLVDGRPMEGWSAADLDPFLGGSGEFRRQLSGRQGVLCWRYLAMAPVDFQESLVLKTAGNRVGPRLALFYMKK